MDAPNYESGNLVSVGFWLGVVALMICMQRYGVLIDMIKLYAVYFERIISISRY